MGRDCKNDPRLPQIPPGFCCMVSECPHGFHEVSKHSILRLHSDRGSKSQISFLCLLREFYREKRDRQTFISLSGRRCQAKGSGGRDQESLVLSPSMFSVLIHPGWGLPSRGSGSRMTGSCPDQLRAGRGQQGYRSSLGTLSLSTLIPLQKQRLPSA